MNIKKIWQQLFLEGDWNIAFRDIAGYDNYEKPFKKLQKIKGYWFADPMLFESQGKTYLFCEAYNKNKNIGELAVFDYVDGKFKNFRIIISENYHMSYPCVFCLNNKIFMIPETSENKTLDLYEATNFPYEWQKNKTLLFDIDLGDSTFFEQNNKKYILSYYKEKNAHLRLYEFDDVDLLAKLAFDKEFKDNVRPAGYFFSENNKLYRPAQDCLTMYGGSMIIYELDFDKEYVEKEVFKFNPSNIVIDGETPTRIHTYTKTSSLEVIDYSIFKFHLFKRINILRRKQAVKKRSQARK